MEGVSLDGMVRKMGGMGGVPTWKCDIWGNPDVVE